MMFIRKNSNKQKGFSLMETVVGSAVFLLVSLSAYGAFNSLMAAVLVSRAKVVATELANEKMEIIRNLPYIDVGIVNGLPSGKINHTENITRGSYSFTISTTIRNVDDPFDGTIDGTPKDYSPADYKLVDLDITCTNCQYTTPLNFTTLVAPHSLETASTNGALFMKVIDSSGQPVQGANIHIVDSHTTPSIIIDDTTGNDGWLKLVDAPPGTAAYNITATKTGYSQDQTYPIGGAAGASPVKPDSNVVTKQVTQVTFSIDKLSSLAVTTVDTACVALPTIGFSITGTKLIGTGVLKYPTQNFSTNVSGTYTIPTIEWDTYSALLTSASYDLVGSTPMPIFDINPNESKTLQLVVTPHINRALLVSIMDASGTPIDGATVRLEKSGFDQTKTTNTGACTTPGQVFWNGLTDGTYTMTVTKAGFQVYTGTIDVSLNWTNQNISLTP